MLHRWRTWLIPHPKIHRIINLKLKNWYTNGFKGWSEYKKKNWYVLHVQLVDKVIKTNLPSSLVVDTSPSASASREVIIETHSTSHNPLTFFLIKKKNDERASSPSFTLVNLSINPFRLSVRVSICFSSASCQWILQYQLYSGNKYIKTLFCYYYYYYFLVYA